MELIFLWRNIILLEFLPFILCKLIRLQPRGAAQRETRAWPDEIIVLF